MKVDKKPELDKLIDKVRNIDPIAAKWIEDNKSVCQNTDFIGTAFSWQASPQGEDFWVDILEKLLHQQPQVDKKPNLERLIDEVRSIDADAAKWISDNKALCSDINALDDAFPWKQTPHGTAFWSNVHHQLTSQSQSNPRPRHEHADLATEYFNDPAIIIQHFDIHHAEWVDIEEPTFSPNKKYRKKPETVKLSLRYYLNKTGDIAFANHDISEEDYFKKWLGYWQEVEIEI